MFAIVVYDISNNKLRKKIHTICNKYGIKVQRSVFEIDVFEEKKINDMINNLKYELNKWKKYIKSILLKTNIEENTETIRIYIMNEKQRQKTVILGDGKPLTELRIYEII